MTEQNADYAPVDPATQALASTAGRVLMAYDRLPIPLQRQLRSGHFGQRGSYLVSRLEEMGQALRAWEESGLETEDDRVTAMLLAAGYDLVTCERSEGFHASPHVQQTSCLRPQPLAHIDSSGADA